MAGRETGSETDTQTYIQDQIEKSTSDLLKILFKYMQSNQTENIKNILENKEKIPDLTKTELDPYGTKTSESVLTRLAMGAILLKADDLALFLILKILMDDDYAACSTHPKMLEHCVKMDHSLAVSCCINHAKKRDSWSELNQREYWVLLLSQCSSELTFNVIAEASLSMKFSADFLQKLREKMKDRFTQKEDSLCSNPDPSNHSKTSSARSLFCVNPPLHQETRPDPLKPFNLESDSDSDSDSSDIASGDDPEENALHKIHKRRHSFWLIRKLSSACTHTKNFFKKSERSGSATSTAQKQDQTRMSLPLLRSCSSNKTEEFRENDLE